MLWLEKIYLVETFVSPILKKNAYPRSLFFLYQQNGILSNSIQHPAENHFVDRVVASVGVFAYLPRVKYKTVNNFYRNF